MLGVVDADERDVVDLVGDVEARRAGDGGLELARQVGELGAADVVGSRISRTAGVPSSTSSAAMPATGEPRMTRGVSPHASAVVRPTASRRRQISGTSSTRIQCSWMFCRSVMSAVSRANSRADLGDGAQLLGAQRAAVAADAEHEVLVVELGGVEGGGLAAVDAGLALGVEPPPAHPAPQVLACDRGEPLLGVDLLDAGADVQAVVGLLELLVGVQRRAVAVGPGAGGLAGLPVRAGGVGRGLD